MALKLSIQTPFGIEAPECYAKITDFFGNKDTLQVNVSFFFNREARIKELSALKQCAYIIETINLSGSSLIASLYTEIKKTDDFEDADDI